MNYDNEEWKAIAGYEGRYSVSDMGRVRSIGRQVRTGFGADRWVKDKILSIQGGKIKYKIINLSTKGKYKTHAVHVLVAIAFLGHKPNGWEIVVDHINGDRHDNRRENLQLLSHRENIAKGFKVVCPNCGYKH